MRTTLGSVALGMIVRDFVSAEPILAFLDNAEKFGHEISHVRLDGGADAGGTR